MKTILLARHGQASFGKDNYDQLSNLGVQQTKLLGEYFSTNQRKVDRIFAGTLVRQQDSAHHFIDKFSSEGKSFPIQTISQFDEFNHEQVLLRYADFDNLSDLKTSLENEENSNKELAKMFKQAMTRWHSAEQLENDEDYDESWLQFAKRCNQGLQQVIEQTEDGQTSLVFTSGGVIASIASRLLNMPTDLQSSQTAFAINRQIINSSVTTIAVKDITNKNINNGLNPDKNQLLTLGACEHLHLAGEELLSWY